MRKNGKKRYAAIILCAIAMANTIPAMPVYARTRSHASSRQSSEERMRDAASQVQIAFDSQDMDKLAELCNYPVVVSFSDGNLTEIQNKTEFLALGKASIFTQKMLDAIAATNTAKLTSDGMDFVQMGGDNGLALYKINGKWKINNFYLESPSGGYGQDQAVNISSLPEMAEQIQKTFSYKSLDTLAMMCNYPMIMSYADGRNVEIHTPKELIALGEDKVFTDKLLKAIDKVDVNTLTEADGTMVQMGGDSGLNMYRFNGYWKINQIYQ